MRGQHLLPFLIGEIDVGGNQLVVGFGEFLRTGTAHGLRKDLLHLLQGVGTAAFIVVAVATALQLSGTQATVGVLGHDGRDGDTGHPAQVESLLLARCPAEVTHRRITHGTLAVAVESHCHPSVDIAGSDIGRWYVEVLADNLVEGAVGFLVGVVAAAVAEGTELLLADVVGQHRRVVALHEEFIAVLLNGELSPHAVLAKQLTELVGHVAAVGHGF